MSERKERPILFNGEMVRAILASRKTQTRRVCDMPLGWSVPPARLHEGRLCRFGCDTSESIKCRYGQPSDRLWVRETWGLLDTEPSDAPERATVGYRANGVDKAPNGRFQLWRPSIFMPRWASRLTLEIVRVRMERLQDISEEDAKAEGVEPMSHGFRDYSRKLDAQLGDARMSYFTLWESINGKGSWVKNLWVWVIEFTVLHPAQNQSSEPSLEQRPASAMLSGTPDTSPSVPPAPFDTPPAVLD